MTRDPLTYTLPELVIVPTNSVYAASKLKPELTRIDQGQLKPSRFLPIYRICYLDRRSLDKTIKSAKERGKVNLSSLCSKRVALVLPIIIGLLEGHSLIPKFNLIESIFDWIDHQERSAELNTIEGTRRLYEEYTDLLRHRLRLSNVGNESRSIGYPRARDLQVALMYVCSLATKYDFKVIQSWAIRIPHKKIGLNELPAPSTTADEHALAYALHQRFFEAFTQAVLKNITPPVVVKLADLGFEDLIFYSQIANNAGGWSEAVKGQRTDWKPFFYRPEGVFGGNLKAFNALLSDHSIAPLKSKNFERMKKNNRNFSRSTLIELANHATRHFCYLLLAEAGNNATHLASINCHPQKLDKATGLASTRAIKGRAGFEDQEQLVDSRFANNVWRQYQKLRCWMAQQLEAPPELGLFLLVNQKDSVPYTLLSGISMPMLPLWPAGAPSLSTRDARKHKTVNLLEGSGGDSALVAGMQFAKPQTIERHYAFKNREEAAKAMSRYFTAQAISAELRHLGIKPVRIIEGGEKTHLGMCDADEDGPKLIEGLENIAIEPRCGAPITCIFCAHFGLHADVKDILRLLTIKLWIEVQSRHSSINIDEHFEKFAIYLNRIEQILEELSHLNGKISQHVSQAIASFERGERDQYWSAKISALLDMEET